MRATFAGRALLLLGVTVGVSATAAWAMGFDPATLPPALLKIAAYKLTGLAAFGLMAAGAVVLRMSRQNERNSIGHLSHDRVPELKAGDELARQSGNGVGRVREPVSERRDQGIVNRVPETPRE